MKNWTIARRIIFGFSTLLIIAAAYGVFAFSRLVEIGKDADRVAKQCLPWLYSTGQLGAINLANSMLAAAGMTRGGEFFANIPAEEANR